MMWKLIVLVSTYLVLEGTVALSSQHAVQCGITPVDVPMDLVS
jgi:hypothetical protein